MPEIMGAGVALFDADGDEDLDLFCPNGSAEAGGNRFYRQVAPGRFEDATRDSGLGTRGIAMGVAVGDMDNSGSQDLYVTHVGPDRLFRNQGDGTFLEVTEESGISSTRWSSSALFFDFDRDGLLDLFVVRYVDFDDDERCFDKAGRPDYCGPQTMPPVPDQLFHNEGSGKFRDVSDESGIGRVAAAGLGAVAQDFNGDGWPDLAVANDAEANHLWINRQDGTFEELALPWGFAFNQHGHAEAGMGIVSADFDGDLVLDLFLTHLGVETNTVYRGVDGRGFQDVTGTAGVAKASMPFTGFGIVALDADLDGDLDVMVANGRVFRGKEDHPDDPWRTYAEPNQWFVNQGSGRFQEVTSASAFTEPVEITRGLACGDLDGDGDLDAVLANVEGPARLYRNTGELRGSWLQVRALDPRWNRDAIGASITVRAESASWRRTIDGQGSYQSSSPLVAHFGLGSADTVNEIRVLWPDGLEESFPGGETNRRLKLERGSGTSVP